MSVHYVGGGGLLGTLGSVLGLASMAIPGMQQFAPYIGAANSLMSGNFGGAVASAAAPSILKAFKGKPPAPNESLVGALGNAHRGNAGDLTPDLQGMMNAEPQPDQSLLSALSNARNAGGMGTAGMPAWNTDPVTGEQSRYKRPWGAR